MKKSIKYNIIVSLVAVVSIGFADQGRAQTAHIKDIPADQEGTTTISISKGDKKISQEFEITEGSSAVSGEPEVLQKEARNSWKKECADWKKELKELNKENSILMMNCGQPDCAKTGMSETICKSEATYKIKVKMK